MRLGKSGVGMRLGKSGVGMRLGKSGVGMRLGKSGVGMVCGRVRHETIAYTKVSALKQLPCEHRLSFFKWLPK